LLHNFFTFESYDLQRISDLYLNNRWPNPKGSRIVSATSALWQPGLDTRPDSNTTLREPLLSAARIAWVVIFIGTWVCFIRSVALDHNIGWSMRFISQDRAAGYTLALDLLVMVVSSCLAGMIAWRRSDDWLGLLTSITVVTFSAAQTGAITFLVPELSLWGTLAHVVQALGDGLILLLLFIFPDGRFVPSWSRFVAVAWGIWVVTWPFVPAVSPMSDQLPIWFSFATLTPLYVLGLLSQIYRRNTVTNPIKRLQTKWTMFGFGIALVGFFVTSVLVYAMPMPDAAGDVVPLVHMALPLFNALTILAIPVALGVSMMRFRLWEIDPLLHQTVIYGAVTTGLSIVFVVEILVFQAIFQAITGQQSQVAVVLSTLIIAALFQPARTRARRMIDRRFYREKIDFEKAFTDLSHEIRTIIAMPELSNVLLGRVMELLHISYGAVFLRKPDGSFHLEDKNIPAELCDLIPLPESFKLDGQERLSVKPELLNRLKMGHVLTGIKDLPFAVIVPLTGARHGKLELHGILAYGPRRSGQAYSREDLNLLRNLADQAATASYVAHLIEVQRVETKRREEAEHALEAHRNSPLGRAEAFAETLAAKPETVIAELHELTQKAGADPEMAALLTNLYHVLGPVETDPISGLASGYMYLFNAQQTPELLLLGLRTLIARLETAPVRDWSGARETMTLYRLAQRAVGVQTIGQITELVPGFEEEIKACGVTFAADKLPDVSAIVVPSFLEPFKAALGDLACISDTLRSYERVDTTHDKLSYLVSALERLSRVDHSARTDLGSADRAVILRISETWLGIVSNAMSELQTRAQISCRLLTHHTWQDDVIALSLSLRNDGQGAALNVRVNLSPSPDYTLVDPAVVIQRLGPDEETQVELRVRPRLTQKVDQFRVRFIVQYSDPRGPDQVEHYADVVYLLTSTGEFQFIPNPYVVGTPLQPGSPLFFGREDVVGFIRDNLAAAHRNNLVLIGHRRTGKTSLLKQLPRHLGEGYLPVYLDGQALSLDPGMANFFLNLATEINFAIEDRGLTPPAIPDFTDSPAGTFERVYLAAVRSVLGDRHLLILFDEFEELESAVQRGNLDPSVFNFLRHIIQHGENVSAIFCGTHRMEELAADYWSVLFNISLYRNIGFLEQPEAFRLIQEPVAKFDMRYDDLALDKIWRITAGHPYFLQLLCHSLVNRHNKTKRNYVTVADVNAALDEILAAGEAHFVYMWAEANPQERLVLTALSRLLRLTGRATPVQVVDYLEDRGIHLERAATNTALHHLVVKDILSESDDADAAGEVYRWRLGLLGLWVEKYKSMSRVADEARAAQPNLTPSIPLSTPPLTIVRGE